ncbi:hypothetical protein DIPPA_26582 [Diplonema papillatum]|nr:hypothetical protein DIPPA_26582 [Diplonema papillatum]
MMRSEPAGGRRKKCRTQAVAGRPAAARNRQRVLARVAAERSEREQAAAAERRAAEYARVVAGEASCEKLRRASLLVRRRHRDAQEALRAHESTRVERLRVEAALSKQSDAAAKEAYSRFLHAQRANAKLAPLTTTASRVGIGR